MVFVAIIFWIWHKKTGAFEFHTSAKVNIESKMGYKNESMNENLKTVGVLEDEVRMIKDLLSKNKL